MMKHQFVPFDAMRKRAAEAVDALPPAPAGLSKIWLVRNLHGRLRICVGNECEADREIREFLRDAAVRLHEVLGVRSHEPEQGVLFVGDQLLDSLEQGGQPLRPGSRFYLADRLVAGTDWWTVAPSSEVPGRPQRFTLYSVKGGVGRSTTAAILAWDLARRGRRVLVLDLDLESPGLSPVMLERERRPEFGVTDWFVEDLVGQGDRVLERMAAAPAWARDFEGAVHIVPAHGRNPGEYLAKLGRVYLGFGQEEWTARLKRLLQTLEKRHDPEVVLIESRSGLHDIAAATVTDLGAEVLLFGTDSESAWDGYRILFRHWQELGLARDIRERLWTVSALTPEFNTGSYLARFRLRAWELFQEYLYDELAAGEGAESNAFSFGETDDDAPHHPLPIHWNRGLAAGASLLDIAGLPTGSAYGAFLERFHARFPPRPSAAGKLR